MRRTTGHPILPIELFDILLRTRGEETADWVLDMVQEGTLSVDEVIRVINRPDIEPEDWRDFEDGWRPEGWDD